MDLLICIRKQWLKPRVDGCVRLGAGVMTLWHLIQSQARDTNIKPGISTVQENKMLQTMTSLRKEAVLGILTREPRTTCCVPPPPSQAEQQEFSIVLQGKVQIASRRKRGRENIPVSSWNQDKGWGRTATIWTKSDTLCLVPKGKNGLC